MTAPTLADAENAMADARQHLDIAAASCDEAVKRDRYRQAAARLGWASRVLGGLAPEAVDPARWGLPLNMPASARGW